jgi:hypothetical protein
MSMAIRTANASSVGRTRQGLVTVRGDNLQGTGFSKECQCVSEKAI